MVVVISDGGGGGNSSGCGCGGGCDPLLNCVYLHHADLKAIGPHARQAGSSSSSSRFFL